MAITIEDIARQTVMAYEAQQKYEQEARAMQQAAAAIYQPTSIQSSQWTGSDYSAAGAVGMGISGGVISSAVIVYDVGPYEQRIAELEAQLSEKDEIIEALSSMVEEIDDLRQENAELRIADAMKPEPDSPPEIIWPESSPDVFIAWDPPDLGPAETRTSWRGAAMPEVLRGKRVYAKFRGYEEAESHLEDAEAYRWNTFGPDDKAAIVAYKVA